MVCVKLPEGELLLTPGKPISLPKKRAQRLIEKAQGKIRLCQPKRSARVEQMDKEVVTWRVGGTIRGPANVLLNDRQIWFLVFWKGNLIWVSKRLLCSEQ